MMRINRYRMRIKRLKRKVLIYDKYQRENNRRFHRKVCSLLTKKQ